MAKVKIYPSIQKALIPNNLAVKIMNAIYSLGGLNLNPDYPL